LINLFAGYFSGEGTTMAGARARNIILILLVGFSLTLPHVAFAQSSSVWDTADATALNQQVFRLYSQGRYSEAIPLAQRVLASQERTLGPDHPNLAMALNDLAVLYIAQGNYADAEQLLKRTLSIQEKALGPDHPDEAPTLNFLAELYRTQGRYADAEPLYKRSLANWETRSQ
jgi:tetratricopeptide (TPR) repeat protein